MRETTAQHAGHRFLNLGVAGPRILVEESLGGHDHAVDAEAALRRPLVNKRFLNRVRLFESSDAFQRGDVGARYCIDGRYAGADRLTLYDHRARSALPQAATELRPAQLQIVAQHIQQRSRRVHIHGVRPAVDFQIDCAHVPSLTRIIAVVWTASPRGTQVGSTRSILILVWRGGSVE